MKHADLEKCWRYKAIGRYDDMIQICQHALARDPHDTVAPDAVGEIKLTNAGHDLFRGSLYPVSKNIPAGLVGIVLIRGLLPHDSGLQFAMILPAVFLMAGILEGVTGRRLTAMDKNRRLLEGRQRLAVTRMSVAVSIAIVTEFSAMPYLAAPL